MKSFLIASALAISGLIAPQAASAALVTYYISGQTQQTSSNGLSAPTTSFNGSFVFDTSLSPEIYTNEFNDTYIYHPVSGTLTAYGSTGQILVNQPSGSGLSMSLRVSDSKTSQFADSVTVDVTYFTEVVSSSPGNEIFAFAMTRYADSGALSSASIPSSLSSLTNSTGSAFVISNDGSKTQSFNYSQFYVSTVAPSVPEPATWIMLLIGFGLISAAVRRRRPIFAASFA